eukprot:13725848-Alexandrium_andersonii.AAC.1
MRPLSSSIRQRLPLLRRMLAAPEYSAAADRPALASRVLASAAPWVGTRLRTRGGPPHLAAPPQAASSGVLSCCRHDSRPTEE